jgi:hypothetical protein
VHPAEPLGLIEQRRPVGAGPIVHDLRNTEEAPGRSNRILVDPDSPVLISVRACLPRSAASGGGRSRGVAVVVCTSRRLEEEGSPNRTDSRAGGLLVYRVHAV